jgi:hypothetical protein
MRGSIAEKLRKPLLPAVIALIVAVRRSRKDHLAYEATLKTETDETA